MMTASKGAMCTLPLCQSSQQLLLPWLLLLLLLLQSQSGLKGLMMMTTAPHPSL
jgi:hypothetical protein